MNTVTPPRPFPNGTTTTSLVYPVYPPFFVWIGILSFAVVNLGLFWVRLIDYDDVIDDPDDVDDVDDGVEVE